MSGFQFGPGLGFLLTQMTCCITDFGLEATCSEPDLLVVLWRTDAGKTHLLLVQIKAPTGSPTEIPGSRDTDGLTFLSVEIPGVEIQRVQSKSHAGRHDNQPPRWLCVHRPLQPHVFQPHHLSSCQEGNGGGKGPLGSASQPPTRSRTVISSRGSVWLRWPHATSEQHPGKSQVEENKHNQPGL